MSHDPLLDIVFIRGLNCQAVIGAYDWERGIRQELRFDVEMSTSIVAAAASDDLADAQIDYAAVAARIRDFVEASSFELIETLAHRLAELLREEFRIEWLRLCVTKPRPDDGFDAGLVIERGSRSS